jgi:hypothetical protein
MLQALEPTLSQARLGTYLLAAGHDPQRALAFYQWNTQLGEAFHLPIQAVEVALRNRINVVFVSKFGPEWWQDQRFLLIADQRQIAAIDEVKKRISKRGQNTVTGQIVAGLSFGFWVSMLDARHNQIVWSQALATGFPDLPAGKLRKHLQQESREIANFRNRIWHHEPIFRADITAEYSRCMKVLGWLCRYKLSWVKPQCKVMSVVRAKP